MEKKTLKLINLTSHQVSVYGDDVSQGPLAILNPDGTVARIGTENHLELTVNGIPVYVMEPGEIVGLPAPQDGVGWIVSTLVRQALAWRRDLFSPGELIRNEQGQPIGCRGLVCN